MPSWEKQLCPTSLLRLNVIVAESRFKTGAGGTAACTVCLYNSVARVIGGRRKRRYIKIVV